LKSLKFDTFLKYSLYSYLIWSFIRFSLTFSENNTFWIVPYISPLTGLIEPVYILLFIVSAIIICLKGTKIKIVSAIFISLILLAFITSSFISTGSIVNSFKFFAGYYKFIPLFLISTYLYKREQLNIETLLKIIIGLIGFQFAINLLWFYDIQILRNTRALLPGNPDWAYGTMENTHMLAVSYIVFFVLGLFCWSKKYRRLKLVGLLILVIGVVQLAWSESKANFLTTVLSLFFILIIEPGKGISMKKFGLIIGLLFGFVFVSALVYSDLSHFAASEKSTWANIKSFWDVLVISLEYNYKIQFLSFIINDFQEDILNFLFGAGPGILASNFAIENPTYLSQEYFIPLMNKNFNTGNSILMNPHTGYTAILGDLGWFGFISYFGFHFYLLFKLSLKFKNGKFKSNHYRLAAMIWIGLMVNYLLNNIFKDILYIGAPIAILWILGGILLSYSYKHQMKYKLVEGRCQ